MQSRFDSSFHTTLYTHTVYPYEIRSISFQIPPPAYDGFAIDAPDRIRTNGYFHRSILEGPIGVFTDRSIDRASRGDAVVGVDTDLTGRDSWFYPSVLDDAGSRERGWTTTMMVDDARVDTRRRPSPALDACTQPVHHTLLVSHARRSHAPRHRAANDRIRDVNTPIRG